LGYVPPASSALAYYRERWRASIDEARASRTERALTEGLALRAERVAKLKEHAEALDALRFVPDKNGRLWNERAYRQTLADIAEEMGERRPKESEQSGEVVKVVIGIDPDRV
jgi:predicted ABC-class ATPase